MFAVMLHDAGVLDNLAVLDCPCNGACPHVTKDLASFDQVDQMRKTDPAAYQRCCAGIMPTTSVTATPRRGTPDRSSVLNRRKSP